MLSSKVRCSLHHCRNGIKQYVNVTSSSAKLVNRNIYLIPAILSSSAKLGYHCTKINCNIISVYHRLFSTVKLKQEVSRGQFKKVFLALQSGNLEAALNDLERCYSKGFSLPKEDVFMIVYRISESENNALVDKLLLVLEKYDEQFVLKHAPLFCYSLILKNDLSHAFSFLSACGDKLIAQMENSSPSSSRRIPSLPQEFLIAKLCMELMNDSKSSHRTISPLTRSLPRYHSSITSTISHHSTEIIISYLFSWRYLVAASHYNTQSQNTTSSPTSQESTNIRDLFPSMYDVSGSDKTTLLDQCVFSSFTRRFCDQRLRSTLRSLELFLWFSYSRSVLDAASAESRLLETIGGSSSDESVSNTIEDVYDVMANHFDFWNTGIFQFFVFYYSQPIPRSVMRGTRVETGVTMRNTQFVIGLLNEMKKREMQLSRPLALTLMSRSDLPEQCLRLVFSFFLDENRGKSALLRLVNEEEDVINRFVQAISRRNDSKTLEMSFNQFQYLSISLQSRSLNEILFAAAYMGDGGLVRDVISQMEKSGCEMTDESVCAVVFWSCFAEENIEGIYDRLKKCCKNNEIYLYHLLVQMAPNSANYIKVNQKIWEKSIETRKFNIFCKEEGIELTSERCIMLFNFYKESTDYRNMVHLFYFIKRRGFVITKNVYQNMENDVKRYSRTNYKLCTPDETVTEVMNSSFPIVFDGSEKIDTLPKQNEKYNFDRVDPMFRRALSIFKTELPSISINSIVCSEVNDFCKTTIRDYESWL